MSLPILDRDVAQAKVADSALRVSTKTGVVIVGHGSRDPHANTEFEELVHRFRALRPELDVSHAYVELANPSIATALSACAAQNDRVIVIPLFLFTAGHLKNDIPLALAAARAESPNVEFVATRELGVHTALIDLAFEHLRPFLSAEQETSKTALIVVGRGASDPDANADFCKLVRLLGEGRNFSWVLPCFIGITHPLFEEALELVSRSRPDRILVLPYFLFAGRLYEKLQDQVSAFSARSPWIKVNLASCLGVDDRVLNVVAERMNDALTGKSQLPCDTCQYRAPISGVTQNVGGLRSLLWSLRHAFTHTQAVPHVHAHRALKKHVFVCGNVDCAERGSIALISTLRRAVDAAGWGRDIRITRTGCMGRCGEGPTVAIYPDGIWYRGVQESDAQELVTEHLGNDRLVARLVDNIMQ
jgi:sirohydrochlorin cobaltochelatase